MNDVKTTSLQSMLRNLEAVQNKKSRTRSGPGTSPVLAILATLACAAAIFFFIMPASAYVTPEGIKESGKVYVSDVTLDPATLFSGDKCTITYYVTNGNQNDSVSVNHATFGGSDSVRLVSESYDTNANIGPLQTRSFVFVISSDAAEGSYFPTFSLSYRDADSLYYRTQVKVDDTPLILTVIDRPDTFTQDKKDTLQLQIANPRENDVRNVVVMVSGTGITATPSEKFVGTITAGNATNVSVAVTPSVASTLDIVVSYDNGDNHHSVEKSIPVTFGVDKKQAAPQLSNIKVTLEGNEYHVTGDITNAGLTTANGVSVTSLAPAIPQDPYQSYVIGALKADDFGSFEVTFSANGASTVPLQVSYKDADGNIVTSQKTVSISSAGAAGSASQPGPSSPLLPLLALVVVIAIGGGYLYLKRKKTP